MIFVIGTSIAIRILAAAWTVFLIVRLRDWRIGFLTLLFSLMAFRQALTLWSTPVSDLHDLELIVSELPGLAVSILGLVAIFYLEKVIADSKKTRDITDTFTKRFQELAENLEDIFWMTSPDGKEILYLSPAYETIFKRKAEDIYRNPANWIEFVLPEDRPVMMEHFNKEGLVRGLYDVEYRIRRPDNSIRWIHDRGFPIKNDFGEVYRLAGIASDITKKKLTEITLQAAQTELERRVEERTADLVKINQTLKQEITERQRSVQALQESEAKFRQLAENIDQVFWMENREGSESLYVSPAFETVWGLPCEAIKKNPKLWMESIHPEDREKVRQDYSYDDRTKIFEGSYDSEFRIIRPDGEVRWIRDRAFPVRNDAGNVVRVVGIAADVTELKEAESLHSRFGRILQYAANEIYLFDAKTLKFTQVNQGAQQNLGYTMQELQNLTPLDLKPEYTQEQFEALIQPLREDILPNLVFETFHRRKDGSDYPVEVNLQLSKQESPPQFLAIIQDITQRKETETQLRKLREEAEQASRSKSEFLSHMSHELRTPLNAILGYAQLLELNKNGHFNRKEMDNISQIRSAGYHLLELINEVLDLTRIEAGSLTISKENVDVSWLVKKLLPVVKPLADKKKIKIKDHISKKASLCIFADPTRLKQALINLLTNAVKYNCEGGEIILKCEKKGAGRIKIHVQDTGPGIELAQQKMLFEPFERLGNEKSGIEGTGIGLTITKKLLELMDGSISIKSEQGRGSRFTIELPAGIPSKKAPEPTPQAPSSPRRKNENQNGQTILYIEDNPSNLKLVEKYLKDFTSFQFMSSASAREGIKKARKHQPSLILMDINLPEMDGIAALKELLKYPETKSIPVIAVSANAMADDVQKALDCGFRSYITKPVDLSHLVETIQKTLQVATV